jgi:hypothetical protein
MAKILDWRGEGILENASKMASRLVEFALMTCTYCDNIMPLTSYGGDLMGIGDRIKKLRSDQGQSSASCMQNSALLP